MIGSAINVMKVDNNFLPLLVDHGVATHWNGIRVNCTVRFLVPNFIQILSMKGSLGRDLDPGPLPYQGNALPG